MGVLEFIRYILEAMETAGEILLFIITVYLSILVFRGYFSGYCRKKEKTEA